MKQSSIEWAVSSLDKLIPSGNDLVIGAILLQAKAMHKEEMIDFAFKYGDLTMREMSDSFDKEYK